jgi:5'-nucleotidase
MRRFLLLCSALTFACSSSKSPRQLVILHTNDEHSHLLGAGPEQDDFPAPATTGAGTIKGGVSRRSVVLKSERAAATAAGAAHLTVSAGDNMMGTLTQIASTSAAPDFRLMGSKYLNYDVTTLGNHEFDYGPAALAAILNAAKASGDPIPAIVSSNIHFAGKTAAGDDTALSALFDESGGTNPGAPIHRTVVVTTSNGLKVGFVGIMGADAAAVAPLKAPTYFSRAYGQTDDNRIASLSQIYDDIQPWVDRLHRQQHVDVVVALSHGGYDPSNPAKSEDSLIAQNVSGIDVIVSGHSHTEGSTTITNAATGQKVFVQQAGRFGDNVGRITLKVDGDGKVTVDTAASTLIPVDDKTLPGDAAVNGFVAGIIAALEVLPVVAGKSFLKFTLMEALQGPVADPTAAGQLYNYQLGGLDFDLDASTKYQETALHDLVVDAQLAVANEVLAAAGKPLAGLSIEGYGDIRVTKVEKSKSGKVAFADLFRVVPLGASPAGTPGYPLCYVGIYLAEVKAAFELTAGYAYTGHDDLFVVPSGYKFEYDITRPAFNPNGDATDKNNGRVTKISRLSPDDLAAGNLDGTYLPVFDVNIPASISPSGWLMHPLTLVRAVATLYLTTFATFAGVTLKDPVTGVPIPKNDATATIMHRGDTSEIKAWEALARYVKTQSDANGGKVPSRYNKTAAGTVLPRRAICVGAKAVAGNCAY